MMQMGRPNLLRHSKLNGRAIKMEAWAGTVTVRLRMSVVEAEDSIAGCLSVELMRLRGTKADGALR
jgi:hypothetical protein